MIKPIYDEKIIVGVVYNNTFNWYITDKYVWLLNLQNFNNDELASYFSNPEVSKIRNNLITISHDNANIFINNLKDYKVTSQEIQDAILYDKFQTEELEQYFPTLLIDFDKQCLYSQFPEPLNFEEYVPNGWKGEYKDFTNLIPQNQKYWLINDTNIFE